MQKPFRILIEKHASRYVAYPIGIEDVIVGEGNTYDEALDDIKSALRFHIEKFGKNVFDSDDPVLEVFIAEAVIAI